MERGGQYVEVQHSVWQSVGHVAVVGRQWADRAVPDVWSYGRIGRGGGRPMGTPVGRACWDGVGWAKRWRVSLHWQRQHRGGLWWQVLRLRLLSRWLPLMCREWPAIWSGPPHSRLVAHVGPLLPAEESSAEQGPGGKLRRPVHRGDRLGR